ncbi:MAG: DUF721 domain-containing protein [Thermoguttaceae bacterium]|nr:DUF721 domain-containing protein [Thermoguttaceae bacterium]MDW8077840.1 DUF721 domain-containing protein [Thermoguttaceae bacterium]
MRRGSGGPKSLAEILGELAAEAGFGRVLASAECEAAWKRVVGPEIAAQTAVTLPRRGRMDVLVEHSVLLQELSFRKEELLSALKRELPGRTIRELRFRLGTVGKPNSPQADRRSRAETQTDV